LAIDETFAEQISPAALLPRTYLRAPELDDDFLRRFDWAQISVGHTDGMIRASPPIRPISARRDHELVEARQIGDVIRFRPAKARTGVSPVDGADELRVESKPSIFVAPMFLAVQEDLAGEEVLNRGGRGRRLRPKDSTSV